MSLRKAIPGDWSRRLGAALAAAAAVYGLVFLDINARARSAFRQGARYERWIDQPDSRRNALDERFLREKSILDGRKTSGSLSAKDYGFELDILNAARQEDLSDSAAKHAYHWYQDVYRLFSPPETKWARRARYLAPAMKERWREELFEKNVHYEEYMLGLAAGEDNDHLSVYSTRSLAEARRAIDALLAGGVEGKVYDASPLEESAWEARKVVVPRDKFWRAHQILSDFAPPPE